MRIQELESMIKRQGSRTSFESVLSREPPPGLHASHSRPMSDSAMDRLFLATERDGERGFEGPFSDFERGALDALHAQDAHTHDAGPPPNDDQDMDDGPLHITYATATQRPSRTAPADPHGDPSSSSSSTSSSSSVRVKKKKKSKVKKEKSPSRSSSMRRVVRVRPRT